MPDDWTVRQVVTLGFGLPSQFSPSVSYAYSTDQWMLRLDRPTSGDAWRTYFAVGDELRVDAREERTIEIGPARMSAAAKTSRVTRYRAEVVHDGTVLSAAVVDEHVLREAAFSCVAGDVRVFVGGQKSAEGVIEEVWQLLVTSITSSRP